MYSLSACLEYISLIDCCLGNQEHGQKEVNKRIDLMANIRDVARLAKVSISSVSNVLNNRKPAASMAILRCLSWD